MEVLDTNNLQNVFDSKEEYQRFYDMVVGAIKNFTEYRQGKITYGEVMFVLESVLENIRRNSETKTKVKKIEGMVQTPTFSVLMSVNARLLDVLEKKGLLNSSEINDVLNG